MHHCIPSTSNIAQIPQARLVTSWWLVLSTFELESEYGGLRRCDHGHYSDDVEVERGEGGADKIPGRGAILPQSVVRCPEILSQRMRLMIGSWSKQIKEHERDEKAAKGGS